MMLGSFTLGRWGGNTGDEWDDGSFTGVKEIIVEYCDYCILSIAAVYDKQGTRFEAEKHGANYASLGSNFKKKVRLVISSLLFTQCPYLYMSISTY